VNVFGSHVTDGLATYNSDVDMRIDNWDHADADAALRALHTSIALQGWTGGELQLRSRAVVPIIACVDGGSGVALDISLGEPVQTRPAAPGRPGRRPLGVDTTAVAVAFVRRWPTLFPPLVAFLKLLMAQHSSTPWTGGLGSFKVYCLVAHFLQVGPGTTLEVHTARTHAALG
jgi:DNA polymerase sigma